MKYQKSSHATYDHRYHVVWITKYRKPVLNEEIIERLKVIIPVTCQRIGVIILKMWFEEDHVHMYIRMKPTMAISETVGAIKWKSSYIIKKEFYKYLKKQYWWRVGLWAIWYFSATVWEINWEIIAKYVEQQWKEENEVIEIEL